MAIFRKPNQSKGPTIPHQIHNHDKNAYPLAFACWGNGSKRDEIKNMNPKIKQQQQTISQKTHIYTPFGCWEMQENKIPQFRFAITWLRKIIHKSPHSKNQISSQPQPKITSQYHNSSPNLSTIPRKARHKHTQTWTFQLLRKWGRKKIKAIKIPNFGLCNTYKSGKTQQFSITETIYSSPGERSQKQKPKNLSGSPFYDIFSASKQKWLQKNYPRVNGDEKNEQNNGGENGKNPSRLKQNRNFSTHPSPPPLRSAVNKDPSLSTTHPKRHCQ